MYNFLHLPFAFCLWVAQILLLRICTLFKWYPAFIVDMKYIFSAKEERKSYLLDYSNIWSWTYHQIGSHCLQNQMEILGWNCLRNYLGHTGLQSLLFQGAWIERYYSFLFGAHEDLALQKKKILALDATCKIYLTSSVCQVSPYGWSPRSVQQCECNFRRVCTAGGSQKFSTFSMCSGNVCRPFGSLQMTSSSTCYLIFSLFLGVQHPSSSETTGNSFFICS